MKSRIFKIINIVIPLFILICLMVCALTGVPTLPSSRDNVDTSFAPEIIDFLKNNIISIIYFCFALVFGMFVLYFGLLMHKRIANKHNITKAIIFLSLFIFLSGIWLLTDSNTLMLFADSIDTSAAVLASFISFMLMPLLFIECLNSLNTNKTLTVMGGIFAFNIIVFLIFVMLKFDKEWYLCSLVIHHIMIIAVMIYSAAAYIRQKIRNRYHENMYTPIGIVLFFVCVAAAIVLFALGFAYVYSIVVALGFISLILSVSKLILDKSIQSYEKQVQSDIYKNMAYTDSLSKIGNRLAFDSDKQATKNCAKLCYIVLDINFLKKINDKYGHHIGDYIISSAAGIIKDSFSPIGKCYRIGGDEFAVICVNQDEEAVKSAIDKFERSIREHNRNKKYKLSIAYGYEFRDSEQLSAERLLQKADKAMYTCKNAMKSTLSAEGI